MRRGRDVVKDGVRQREERQCAEEQALSSNTGTSSYPKRLFFLDMAQMLKQDSYCV